MSRISEYFFQNITVRYLLKLQSFEIKHFVFLLEVREFFYRISYMWKLKLLVFQLFKPHKSSHVLYNVRRTSNRNKQYLEIKKKKSHVSLWIYDEINFFPVVA